MHVADGPGAIDLETVVDGRETGKCLSIFNIDGSIRKTANSRLFHFFNLEPAIDIPDEYVSLVGMGLI